MIGRNQAAAGDVCHALCCRRPRLHSGRFARLLWPVSVRFQHPATTSFAPSGPSLVSIGVHSWLISPPEAMQVTCAWGHARRGSVAQIPPISLRAFA